MYCKNCGEELEDNAAFCTHCGAAMVETAAPAQPAVQKRNDQAIVGFVISLLSLWLGIFFLILPIVGLVISKKAKERSAEFNSCNGLATAGVAISIASLALYSFMIILLIITILI